MELAIAILVVCAIIISCGQFYNVMSAIKEKERKDATADSEKANTDGGPTP